MTGDQAIRAGALALTRKQLREIFLSRDHILLTAKSGPKETTVHLDSHMAKIVMDALDLDVSNRLEKMGVAE